MISSALKPVVTGKRSKKMPEETNENSATDAAFKQIRKNTACFYIWRVENMHLVAIPKDQYGTFYEGDSYLIYAASEFGKSAKPNAKPQEVKGRLEMHIHFWLGMETSKDESTVAAYKCVELDNYLSGAPVQHREIQGKESARFKGYFKSGMRLLKGGVASGLHHATSHNFEAKLFRIKGRRTPTVKQMPAISWEYFNSGDVFILDTKDVVFVWIGQHANNMEKYQAAKVAVQLKDEHNALSIVFIDDGKETSLQTAEKTLFNVYLDPKVRRGLKIEADDDKLSEYSAHSDLKLYKCTDEGGTYRITEVKTGPLFQTDLNSDDSYIVDKSRTAIWVWVGKNASPKERIEAIRNAHGFVKKKNYPSHIPVSRVIEGGEPVEFKTLFSSWKDNDNNIAAFIHAVGKQTKSIPAKLDLMTLHSMPQVAANTQLIDDGSGKMSIWRVKHTELAEVPYSMYGRFYSGNCYLIHYKYTSDGKENHVLYGWMGYHSNTIDQSMLQSHLTSKDESVGNAAIKIYLTQGKESPHFKVIFHGRMIVLDGEHKDELPTKFLLHVTGNRQHNTRASQVPLKAQSLDSNDVFVLRANDKLCYVWCGKGSTGDEREMAKSIANKLITDEFIVLYEGQEKDDFWKAIGGFEFYSNNKQCKIYAESRQPRLFHCYYLRSLLHVEEVPNFNQNDLISEDTMLLDFEDAVYIWLGSRLKKEEKKQSVNVAKDYLKGDPSKRSAGIPIIVVKQYYEPPTFTGFFETWDYEAMDKEKTFSEVRSELEKQNPVLHVELKLSNGIYDFDECKKYPIEKLLVKNPEKLPDGVDPTLKELHLTHSEFNNVFGMKYENFSELPQWRKDNLKKAAGLF